MVLAAGVVRGFAGFGFSALCVAGLTLFLPPAWVIPPVLVLEVLASLTLLRSAWSDTDWRWLSWLVAGNALCIPLGIALLNFLPEAPLRLLIGCSLVAATALMVRGVRLALAPTPAMRGLTGLVSGLVNGVSAKGGLAVAVMLSTGALSPAALRATMIMLFVFTDLYALLWAGLMPAAGAEDGPLLGMETLLMAAVLAPAMLVGIGFGKRFFTGVSPERFLVHVLRLLLLIALITVTRAVLELSGRTTGLF